MTTQEVVEYYTQLKRIFYNKPIPVPKQRTSAWDNLNRMRVLCEENGIPPDDFILVNIRAYKRRNVFPKPEQLVGLKAFNRYNEYASKKYFKGQLFKNDPSSSLIYATNIYYPIEEFVRPMDKDMKVLLVWTYVKEGRTDFDQTKVEKLWECYCYTLAKYEWFKQTPPNSLLEWGVKLEERRKSYEKVDGISSSSS